MPIAIFLLWPALHLMYGVSQHRSDKIDRRRRIAGRFLLAAAFALAYSPYGWEKGLFYVLFSLMGVAAIFTQVRIWRPVVVPFLTVVSLIVGGLVLAELLTGDAHGLA
ncbi:DUF3325 family protein [Bacterioplanoides sp. SCSIO 12839]|uniref:DUF3325 family protein n=1 Tax=Bacterioplanoides sp. SCSIO 12839 TaxID=2829569 RepID=UPI0021049225|nr:DUF3325 family protein [Bacterioplanoides sp. SCSIO 12839]UTW49955.1 DUF3325 family protein [Bacterioplanoides sp. SCSIO 12839]